MQLCLRILLLPIVLCDHHDEWPLGRTCLHQLPPRLPAAGQGQAPPDNGRPWQGPPSCSLHSILQGESRP